VKQRQSISATLDWPSFYLLVAQYKQHQLMVERLCMGI
jgi:hypothetical protein